MEVCSGRYTSTGEPRPRLFPVVVSRRDRGSTAARPAARQAIGCRGRRRLPTAARPDPVAGPPDLGCLRQAIAADGSLELEPGSRSRPRLPRQTTAAASAARLPRIAPRAVGKKVRQTHYGAVGDRPLEQEPGGGMFGPLWGHRNTASPPVPGGGMFCPLWGHRRAASSQDRSSRIPVALWVDDEIRLVRSACRATPPAREPAPSVLSKGSGAIPPMRTRPGAGLVLR